ncbi:MAG: hypothetical protein CVU78_04580 [Elusimicrobia bacterium HGW-Elusimicrobia-2]|nr:MAG: hypothetical protein CVU78_04580 [Elusimicrobia bacterium HGW-Elusimicrobia-2]
MKKQLLLIIFLAVFQNLSAETAKDVFNRAVAEYIKGEKRESMALMETALSLDGKNGEMKEFFVKMLTEYGSESFLADDYVSAQAYLTKAGNMDPDNQEIRKMLLLCRRMSERGLVAESSAAKEEELNALIKEFKQQKDKFSANFNYGLETINSLLKQSEKEREKLLLEISSAREADRARMNEMILAGIALFALILLAAFYLMHAIMSRFVEKREIVTLEHQKKIMDEMRGFSRHSSLPPLMRNSTHETITDIDPIVREKARRIEFIEEELKTEKDPNIATTFFLPYLDDVSNRVRANAAKALYRHNRKLATATFKDMISSPNEWMRSSAVWALAELAEEETVALVAVLKDDKHICVLEQIKASLKRLMERPDVSESLKGRAAEILKEFRR